MTISIRQQVEIKRVTLVDPSEGSLSWMPDGEAAGLPAVEGTA